MALPSNYMNYGMASAVPRPMVQAPVYGGQFQQSYMPTHSQTGFGLTQQSSFSYQQPTLQTQGFAPAVAQTAPFQPRGSDQFYQPQVVPGQGDECNPTDLSGQFSSMNGPSNPTNPSAARAAFSAQQAALEAQKIAAQRSVDEQETSDVQAARTARSYSGHAAPSVHSVPAAPYLQKPASLEATHHPESNFEKPERPGTTQSVGAPSRPGPLNTSGSTVPAASPRTSNVTVAAVNNSNVVVPESMPAKSKKPVQVMYVYEDGTPADPADYEGEVQRSPEVKTVVVPRPRKEVKYVYEDGTPAEEDDVDYFEQMGSQDVDDFVQVKHVTKVEYVYDDGTPADLADVPENHDEIVENIIANGAPADDIPYTVKYVRDGKLTEVVEHEPRSSSVAAAQAQPRKALRDQSNVTRQQTNKPVLNKGGRPVASGGRQAFDKPQPERRATRAKVDQPPPTRARVDSPSNGTDGTFPLRTGAAPLRKPAAEPAPRCVSSGRNTPATPTERAAIAAAAAANGTPVVVQQAMPALQPPPADEWDVYPVDDGRPCFPQYDAKKSPRAPATPTYPVTANNPYGSSSGITMYQQGSSSFSSLGGSIDREPEVSQVVRRTRMVGAELIAAPAASASGSRLATQYPTAPAPAQAQMVDCATEKPVGYSVPPCAMPRQQDPVGELSLGIDIGEHLCTVTTMSPSDVLPQLPGTENQLRSPSVVALPPTKPRSFGTNAYEKLLDEPASTFNHLFKWIGLGDGEDLRANGVNYAVDKFDNASAQLFARSPPTKLKPQQLLAMLLHNIRMNKLQTPVLPHSVTLTVPASFTKSQRAKVKEAAVISGIPAAKVSVVPSPLAAMVHWRYQNLAALTETPEVVIIVDVGHGYSSAALGAISKDKVEMLDTRCLTMGSYDVDKKMMQMVMNYICAKHGAVELSDTTRGTLERECRKAKVLSASGPTQIQFQVKAGMDVTYPVDETTIIGCSQNLTEAILEMISQLKNVALGKKLNITEMAMIGNGGKLSSIENRVRVAAGDVPFNASGAAGDMAVGMGAALLGIVVPPHLKGDQHASQVTGPHDLHVVDVAPYCPAAGDTVIRDAEELPSMLAVERQLQARDSDFGASSIVIKKRELEDYIKGKRILIEASPNACSNPPLLLRTLAEAEQKMVASESEGIATADGYHQQLLQLRARMDTLIAPPGAADSVNNTPRVTFASSSSTASRDSKEKEKQKVPKTKEMEYIDGMKKKMNQADKEFKAKNYWGCLIMYKEVLENVERMGVIAGQPKAEGDRRQMMLNGYINAGKVEIILKHPDLALECAYKALEIEIANPHAVLLKAKANLALGNLADAKKSLKNANRLSKGDAKILAEAASLKTGQDFQKLRKDKHDKLKIAFGFTRDTDKHYNALSNSDLVYHETGKWSLF